MSSTYRYTSNHLGYLYENPLCQATEIFHLQRGDHIAYYRELPYTSTKGYWHHAIVEEVDYVKDKVCILHFQPIYDPSYKPDKQGSSADLNLKGRVVAAELFFWEDEFYVVEHASDDCLPVEQVIERAYSKLGNTDYHLLKNNCEHYATWCKTGKKYSTQVDTVEKVATKAAASGIAAGVAAALTTKKNKPSTGFKKTLAVAGVVEAGMAINDISKAGKLRKEGKLSKEEYDELVTKRMAVAVGGVAGSAMGASVGASIAGPVGGMVGGVLGEVAGTAVGCIAGHGCVLVRKVMDKESYSTKNLSSALTRAIS